MCLLQGQEQGKRLQREDGSKSDARARSDVGSAWLLEPAGTLSRAVSFPRATGKDGAGCWGRAVLSWQSTALHTGLSGVALLGAGPLLSPALVHISVVVPCASLHLSVVPHSISSAPRGQETVWEDAPRGKAITTGFLGCRRRGLCLLPDRRAQPEASQTLCPKTSRPRSTKSQPPPP